jgi:hypothetical protein
MSYLSVRDEFIPLSACWRDSDNALWLSGEPPTNVAIDVTRFQPSSASNPQDWCLLSYEGSPGSVTVIGSNGGGNVTYDGNAAAFQVVYWDLNDLSADIVYVLGTDGNLWLETGPKRYAQPVQVDADVVAFQAVDQSHAYVLGADGNLWLENYPWGYLPPADRQLVASDISSFFAIGTETVYVLDTNGVLALRTDPGGPNKPWGQVGPGIADSTVQAFACGPAGVYWITGGEDGNGGELYLSTWIAATKQWKVSGPIDGNVIAIACNSNDSVGLLVLGSDGNLWYEPGNVQNRTLVASGVWTHPPIAVGPTRGFPPGGL